MLVLVTGGTGYVGSHAVAAIEAAGHQVRLLVRTPGRVSAALAPLGVAVEDVVVGDVTDSASVERAMDGCDAVVHAAAVYSLDVRDYAAIEATNVRAAQLVLGEATRRALDPIVYVSSTAALLRRDGGTAGPDDEPSTVPATYIQSKAAAERVARALQDDGAPVVSVYPGEVLGPHDPHFGANSRQVRNMLRGLYPLLPRGGLYAVDVRDTAAVLAATLQPGEGPRRYIVPGAFVQSCEIVRVLADITGRRIFCATTPARMALSLAKPVGAIQRVVPFHIPAEPEGALALTCATRMDDTRARRELGVEPRLLRDTLVDMVRWLLDAGHITARLAGRLAAT